MAPIKNPIQIVPDLNNHQTNIKIKPAATNVNNNSSEPIYNFSKHFSILFELNLAF